MKGDWRGLPTECCLLSLPVPPGTRLARHPGRLLRCQIEMQRAAVVALICLVGSLAGCASRAPATTSASGRTKALETRVGLASFYGREFHGRTTASGTRFDMNAMVAAHPSYPFGTRLRVTNLSNGRSVTVRVVDRGPSQELRANGLIIDVSRRAAEVLQFIQQGRTRVRVEVMSWGER